MLGSDMAKTIGGLVPEPTIFSKHTFVALNDNARRLGDLLTNDPGIRTLEVDYGFRTSDATAFRKFVSDHSLPVPDNIVSVIEPPTYETLEKMITALQQLYSS